MEPAVVKNFNPTKYLGKWHEIARYNSFFEPENVFNATAEYSQNEDGTIRVVNTSFSDTGKDSVKGSARVVPSPTGEGKLKVSFFPGVEGDYWIIALDSGYNISLVSTPKRDFLWILSREPKMHLSVICTILKILECIGFDTTKLHFNRNVSFS